MNSEAQTYMAMSYLPDQHLYLNREQSFRLKELVSSGGINTVSSNLGRYEAKNVAPGSLESQQMSCRD